MNIVLKTGLYFFLLLSASISLHAEEDAASRTEKTNAEETEVVEKQYYIVEVILFQHLNEQGKLDEFWNRPDIFDNELKGNSQTNENNLSSDIPALAEYDLQKKKFIPLINGIEETSTDNYTLAESAAHIRYSKNFKLLAHFGWIQRSLSKKHALPIKITSNQFSGNLVPSGEIKLYVSRYLHMQVDLKASKCDDNTMKGNEKTDTELDEQLESGASQLELQTALAENKSSCTNNIYQFKQNRKMRSRELHYLDNPVYGLLVYVTPYKAEKKEVSSN